MSSCYRITWRSVELRTARIVAESESAARQAWIDGDVDYSELIETVEEHIERVEVLSHDDSGYEGRREPHADLQRWD